MTKRALRWFGIGFVLILAFVSWLVASRKLRWTALSAMAIGSHSAVAQDAVFGASASSAQVEDHSPTVINVSQNVIHQNVLRLGINLGGHSFYDSLQITKNLVGRNPGFEGQEWQSVFQCSTTTATSCAGGPNSGSWPEGFLDGGTYEVVSGTAMGRHGTIVHSTAGTDQVGSTFQLSPGTKSPAAGDFIVVRKSTPGGAAAKWDPQVHGGATVATEYKDLSPRTPGSQALRISASGPGQYVDLKQYFDAPQGHSFVRMTGPYTIRFRAKGVAGNSRLGVSVERAWAGSGGPLIRQSITLSQDWHDYTINFNAAELPNASGTVALDFLIEGAEVLLDDVSLEEATSNGTAFRNAVVATLQRLKPGVLRYMDSGQNWGSTLDNMLAPEMARKRSGFNKFLTEPEDIPIGLNDFLVLCEKIDAEPWYSIQLGSSQEDAANLIEFLAGPVSTKYGATRAALGHPKPWTETFSTIHLEYGNEAWNQAQPGNTMPDGVPYGERASVIFHAMRSSPSFSSGHFDLIANGQAMNTYLSQKILEVADSVDTIDIAPYTFNTFSDDSSIEHIFGPMFAEPEMIDSTPTGYVHQQAEVAAKAKRPAKLAIYETNIDTVEGTASQASVNATVPSTGAGIASIDHMLLMLRDLGVTVQNTFQLGGGTFHFNNSQDRNETSPIWAIVVDMGGATNRVRPSFLAQQLANEAIRTSMLATSITGENPTWDQLLSANDKIELKGAHELQTFGFSDGKSNSLIVFNLSRTSPRPVMLAGACPPRGTVTVQTLTSANITDSNELSEKVKIVSRVEHEVAHDKTTFMLPPFSMTTLASSDGGCVLTPHP